MPYASKKSKSLRKTKWVKKESHWTEVKDDCIDEIKVLDILVELKVLV